MEYKDIIIKILAEGLKLELITEKQLPDIYKEEILKIYGGEE